jgi:Zn-dependent protease
MPVPPIGTLGAVIAMDSRVKNRRALFDIGISGPLAGLVPTIIFCVVGLQPQFSRFARPIPGELEFGEPLVFKLLVPQILGAVPEGLEVQIGPMAMAGWVGLLITALNLFPIGQLDGGHILYSLLRRRAHPVASMVLAAAVVGAVAFRLTGWSVMLLLLILMGPKHPPTSDDDVPLGAGRILLGWLTLAFLPLGFTPNPISFPEGLDWQGPPPEQRPFQPPPSDDQRWVIEGEDEDWLRRATPCAMSRNVTATHAHSSNPLAQRFAKGGAYSAEAEAKERHRFDGAARDVGKS